MKEFRAVYASGDRLSYGPLRDTEEGARRDPPENSAETGEVIVGVQQREVSSWNWLPMKS